MKLTIIALIVSIAAGSGALAWGYAGGGLDDAARWLVALGAFWLIAQWRRWHWFAPIGILVMVFAAACGLWIQLPAGWMFLGALGGLLGWDLSDFSRRLHYAAPTDDAAGMERRHLARVGMIAVIGLALSLLVMFVRVRIAFEVAVALVLLAAYGLTRLVMRLRK